MNPHNRSTVLFKQYSYFYTEISFQAADVEFSGDTPLVRLGDSVFDAAVLDVDEFFAENPEDALCRRAYEKCRRLRKSEDKTVNRLLACGFPYKLVKQIMKEAEDGTALPPEKIKSET